MTAIAYPQQRANPMPAILFIAVAACALYIVCNQHADLKHGETAVSLAAQCHQEPEMRFFNPTTKRYLDICRINGTFGVWVWEKDFTGAERNITSFIKEKMTRVDQILQYIRNAGYSVQVRP